MSRMYGFHAPQEKIEPRFWKSTQDFSDVNTGRFVRNAVLSGMTYGGNDLVPAFLKTCDAIHPLVGTQSIDEDTQSCYGGLLDSVNSSATIMAIKSVVQPWNTSIVWAPGGTGVNSWLAVKLPEATLVERYLVASTSSTCPLSWKLQGSLDGTTWTDIHTVETTGTWTAAREEKTFTIPEATRGTYLWYRLYITASNATTMSISTLRLFRAQSLCDRGQLRLDASAASPLLLSFMDGFGVDGVTPVNYEETLSSAIVKAVGDYDSGDVPITGNSVVPVDILAKRNSSGEVVISLEAANNSDLAYLSGGMKGTIDRGFSAVSGSYSVWGREDSNSSIGSGTFEIKKTDNTPFYCSKLRCSFRGYYGSSAYVKEVAGTWTTFMSTSSAMSYTTFNMNRFLLGIKFAIDLDITPAVFYTKSSPYKYRISGGKVYQKGVADTSWSTTQKIKIASAVWNGTDLYQINPRSSMMMQWMTMGNNVAYLDS